LRQTNGVALSLSAAMNSLIACVSGSMLLKLASRQVWRVMMPNQIATGFSQLAEVGVK